MPPLVVYLKQHPDHTAVTLATTHPAKFSDAVSEAIEDKPSLPLKYQNIFDLEENMKFLIMIIL